MLKPAPDSIRQMAFDCGAELCGIAAADRFAEAPKGFHPVDIFPQTRSVAVVATRFPESVFHARTLVPYSATNDTLLAGMTGLLSAISLAIEKQTGAMALPLPGEPYEYWDADKHEGRGTLSLKHAAHLAGMGVIGRNSLLVTPRFGNRVVLGALLLDAELKSDSIIETDPCPEDCTLCRQACPVQAVDDGRVIQKRCRGFSDTVTPKGYALTTCFRCRAVCPNATGFVV